MQTQTKAIRVLLVDDDEDDALLARTLLLDIEGARFDVDWVREYERGIERLREGSEFDVCLVDYRLGAQNGIDFVREASQFCRAPIILLTGQGDHSVDVAAMNAGAADFLHKGELSASLLERSIRYSIQHRRGEEQRIRLLREQAARAQAEAANRAKDEFLAALSHELRTPLTPVLAILSMWKENPSIPASLSKDIAMMRRNVELEARLIDDLLDLTRISRGKLQLHLQPLAAHEILRQAFQTVEVQAREKDLQIKLDLGATNDSVMGDPVRLEQTFWNILSNAVKFTPAGGRIEVRTRNLPDGRLRIEFQDWGVGIEPTLLPRMFDAFEQGHSTHAPRSAGLGLGLAIAKSLVKLHQGTISAHSEGRGAGSTFTIELATHLAPAPKAAARDASDGKEAPALRILLVEDHDDTAEVMCLALEHLGHHVTRAECVSSALRASEQHDFDMLVSDLGLPDGSGVELLSRLRARRPVKAIAVSGFGMEEDVRKSLDAGFNEHLIKPVTLDGLIAAIRKVAHSGN